MQPYDFTPVLETNRLQLRSLMPEDAAAISILRSDPQVNTYLNRPATLTTDEATAYISKIATGIQQYTWMYWAIAVKTSPELIGTICLWNFVPENDKAEIGYELSPAYQGKGLMQEAVDAVIRFGFEEMKLQLITALVKPGNEKSQQLLERHHFRPDHFNHYVSKEEAGEFIVFFLLNKHLPR
jgi:ribosomal-protein-alanine N-acetyltransferase